MRRRAYMVWICDTSTYKFEGHFFRHERRIATKFGTHVRIDTLTLKKKKNPTPPQGG